LRLFELVATDIDGTLTDRELHLHPAVVASLQRLELHSLPVTLATANAMPVGWAIRTYMGASGPLIAENGGVVMFGEEVEVLGDRRLAVEAFEDLKRNFPQVTESFTNRFRSVGVSMRATGQIEPLREFIGEHYPELRLMDSAYNYHLIDKGISKGLALKSVVERLKLNLERVVALGDSDVDVSMFEVAGYSIAVGNASEAAKKHASKVTDASFGEGFVEAVWDWILPQHLGRGGKR
jgi:phosphoglycolate phosphatase